VRRLLVIGLLLLFPLFLPSSALGATTPYKLLVWGDCRPWTTSATAVSTGFTVIANSMLAQHANHAIAGGDYVYLGTSDSVATINAKYDAFFATYDTVGVKTDYVMGNHEADGPNGRTVYYSRVHPQPAYYTVSDGPFHVIVLNTNEPGFSKHIGFYGVGDSRNSVQADWLVGQLQAITSRRAWIIVALHHPLLDPETDDPFATTAIAERDALVKLFHAYGVDLVVQGDSHFYRRHHRTDGSNYVTEGMAGAPPVAASTTPIDAHDVTTLGSTGSSPLYGYVTVKRDKTGTITGRMFWMQSSDSWTRHLGDKWTLKQVVRTGP
jgi:hypothetical protein